MLASACVRQLPALPPPPPIAPPQATASPGPGQGRLIVDVVDGPTPVQRVHIEARPRTTPTGKTFYDLAESPQQMCPASPCIADLAPGNVLVGFPVIGDPDALEVELVNIGTETSVYRRSLSLYEDNTGGLRVAGILMTVFGAASAITGTALLPIGLKKDNSGLTLAGGITLGGGIALLAAGIWAIRTDAPTFRPGASNHFAVGEAPPPVTAP